MMGICFAVRVCLCVYFEIKSHCSCLHVAIHLIYRFPLPLILGIFFNYYFLRISSSELRPSSSSPLFPPFSFSPPWHQGSPLQFVIFGESGS